MKDLILELKSKGKTVLMCSHRLEDVQDVCGRIAILHNGDHESWDARFASNPFVLRNGSVWGMYYFGLDWHGKARELLAIGRDPYHFTKVNEILIDVGAPGTVDDAYAHKPSTIYHDGKLYHFYCAVSGKWPTEIRGVSVACSKPW